MTDAEWQEWARTHKACWEVQPLLELHDGRRSQVGFEFNLFAQFPPGVSDPEARKKAFSEVRQKLEELTASVFPSEGAAARFEADPITASVKLRPESEFEPELQATVRVFHRSDYFQSVADGDRQRLHPLEERLKALGLKPGSWGAKGR